MFSKDSKKTYKRLEYQLESMQWRVRQYCFNRSMWESPVSIINIEAPEDIETAQTDDMKDILDLIFKNFFEEIQIGTQRTMLW